MCSTEPRTDDTIGTYGGNGGSSANKIPAPWGSSEMAKKLNGKKPLLVLAVLVLFIIVCRSSRAEENPYDMIPARPDLKELAAELQRLTCRIAAGELESRLRLALKLIVEHHPNPAVGELNRLIVENQILLLFSSEYLTGLKEVAHDAVPADKRRGEERAYYLVLAFDPDLLLCVGNEGEVRGIMIALDHEMFHYRQWLAARPNTAVFHAYKYMKNAKLMPDLCRRYWQNELAAYRRTCSLVAAWGNESMMPTDNFCRYGSGREFEEELYLHFLRNSSMSLACKKVWREDFDKENK